MKMHEIKKTEFKTNFFQKISSKLKLFNIQKNKLNKIIKLAGQKKEIYAIFTSIRNNNRLCKIKLEELEKLRDKTKIPITELFTRTKTHYYAKDLKKVKILLREENEKIEKIKNQIKKENLKFREKKEKFNKILQEIRLKMKGNHLNLEELTKEEREKLKEIAMLLESYYSKKLELIEKQELMPLDLFEIVRQENAKKIINILASEQNDESKLKELELIRKEEKERVQEQKNKFSNLKTYVEKGKGTLEFENEALFNLANFIDAKFIRVS